MMKFRYCYNNTLLWITVFLNILSYSAYAYMNKINDVIYGILSIIPLFYLAINKINITLKSFSFLLIYYIITGIYFFSSVASNKLLSFSLRYWVYLPAMILLFLNLKEKKNKLFEYFSSIMFAISIISLFFWLFGTTLNFISPSGEVYVKWGHTYRTIYYGLYIEVPGRIFGSLFQRNVGIFCEGPAFSYMLGLALSFELFISRNKKMYRIIVFILTLLSTGTTAGLFIIMYCLFLYLWDITKRINRSSYYLRTFLLIVGLLGGIVVFKFATIASKMPSIYLRKADYINGYKAFINAPFFGHGYMIDSYTLFNTGYSSGLTQIAVSGGLLLILIYIVPFVAFFFKYRKAKTSCYWVLLTGILFCTSVVGHTYIVLMILAYLCAKLLDDNDSTIVN